MSYRHQPVLLQEVISGLKPQPGQNFIDGTVGGGGHAHAILKATAPAGKLVAFDRDQEALLAAKDNLAEFGGRVIFIHDSYANLKQHVTCLNPNSLDGMLLDLGLSSAQLQDTTRGFSFQQEGPLDLRFNKKAGITASELLQITSSEELERIFREYGEEPQARALAKRIVEERRTHPLHTTQDLLTLVKSVKGGVRRSFHPATLVWQALRIAVNQELDELSRGLSSAVEVLSPGAKLVVISFHSGEDRIVKNFFRTRARTCLCPPSSPVCRCGHKASLKVLTTKPVTASAEEVAHNPRARSAKLRIAQKL